MIGISLARRADNRHQYCHSSMAPCAVALAPGPAHSDDRSSRLNETRHDSCRRGDAVDEGMIDETTGAGVSKLPQRGGILQPSFKVKNPGEERRNTRPVHPLAERIPN